VLRDRIAGHGVAVRLEDAVQSCRAERARITGLGLGEVRPQQGGLFICQAFEQFA
jgi:hypothetical protein